METASSQGSSNPLPKGLPSSSFYLLILKHQSRRNQNHLPPANQTADQSEKLEYKRHTLLQNTTQRGETGRGTGTERETIPHTATDGALAHSAIRTEEKAKQPITHLCPTHTRVHATDDTHHSDHVHAHDLELIHSLGLEPMHAQGLGLVFMPTGDTLSSSL